MNSSTHVPGVQFSNRTRWASRGAISFLMQQGVENPGVLSLAAGLVDPKTLPVQLAQDQLKELLSDDSRARECLQYGTTPGSEHLRQELLPFFTELEHSTPEELNLSADDLVLSTGSQQLLSLVCDALFDPGDICLVAAPTYFVFLGALEAVGARAVSVKTDERGMCPDALHQTLTDLEEQGELGRVKLIYLVSYYENPSGVSLATERRQQIVELAKQWSKSHRLMILEDAAYRELQYDGEVFPSVWSFDRDRQHVIYTQTFSKSFSPGVRVGFGILPEDLKKPISDLKGNDDFGSAHLNQRLMAQVLTSGKYREHVEQVKASYQAKRDAMLAAAEAYFSDLDGVTWLHPHGGLYVWMSLPDKIPTGFDSPLFERAVHSHNVMYVPGELCFSADAVERNHMRLSYGVLTPEFIDRGMKSLSLAIRDVLESESLSSNP